jgi:hypothetical protein
VGLLLLRSSVQPCSCRVCAMMCTAHTDQPAKLVVVQLALAVISPCWLCCTVHQLPTAVQ